MHAAPVYDTTFRRNKLGITVIRTGKKSNLCNLTEDGGNRRLLWVYPPAYPSQQTERLK